jgi:hypothetical protein
MEEFTSPEGTDLLREAIIVIVGLIIRAIEKRRLKKSLENAKSENTGL